MAAKPKLRSVCANFFLSYGRRNGRRKISEKKQRVHNERFIHICARQRQHNNTVTLIISLCDGGLMIEKTMVQCFFCHSGLSLFLLSVPLELKLITTVVHVKMCQRSIQFRLKLDTICRLQLSPQRTRE